ncbi:hypothetical protein ACFXPS_17030 [Nocardia sp. NPDC059091]|uniref:DUF6630 family protein n=1 Tax=Nocardia sp. NPDC059091 TaxID=3346724 RepID=UPI00367720C1
MTEYGRDTFVEIARYLASDRPVIADAVRQHDDDSDALEELLIGLEEAEVIVWRVAKEDPATVVRLLQSLPAAPQQLPVGWFEFICARTDELDRGSAMELLLELIGELSLQGGTSLIEIDTQADDYALTFLPVESARRFVDIAPAYLAPMRLSRDATVRFAAATDPALRTEVHFAYKVTGLDNSDHAFEVLQAMDSFYERMLTGWWVSGTIDQVDDGPWAALGDTEGTPLHVIDFERWQPVFTDELRQVVSSLAPRAQTSIGWDQTGA